MRGGLGYQINEIFNTSGIFQVGKSKHLAKAEARDAGARNWSEIGKALAIYSYSTAECYKDVWHTFARFLKNEFKLKDTEKISAEHVRSYLENRIADGVALATIIKEAAALSKLENAMNLYSQKYQKGKQFEFRSAIKEVIQIARQELSKANPHRAYNSAEIIINAINKEDHRIAALCQLESGARVHEISLVKSFQLLGFGQDNATDKKCGIVEIRGKGGKIRELCLSLSTYGELAAIIKRDGKFSIDKMKYRADILNACLRSGLEYTGSHGFRWTFAQRRMKKLQSECGMTYEQSLLSVSRDLGHERADITEHYLR